MTTLILPAENNLTITTPVDASGFLVRLSDNPGGEPYAPVALARSTTVNLGPFSNVRRYRIDTTSGVISHNIERATDIAGWKDLRTSLTAAATGAGTPSLQAFGPTGSIKQRRFAIGDSVYLAAHWNHDHKPGTTCHVHVHWATDGTSTNYVTWKLAYTQAQGFGNEVFGEDTAILISNPASGAAWTHETHEDATGFTVPLIDTVTIMELTRVANATVTPNPGADNADDVFGLFVDFHYQSGPAYGTRDRFPPFY